MPKSYHRIDHGTQKNRVGHWYPRLLDTKLASTAISPPLDCSGIKGTDRPQPDFHGLPQHGKVKQGLDSRNIRPAGNIYTGRFNRQIAISRRLPLAQYMLCQCPTFKIGTWQQCLPSRRRRLHGGSSSGEILERTGDRRSRSSKSPCFPGVSPLCPSGNGQTRDDPSRGTETPRRVSPSWFVAFRRAPDAIAKPVH